MNDIVEVTRKLVYEEIDKINCSDFESFSDYVSKFHEVVGIKVYAENDYYEEYVKTYLDETGKRIGFAYVYSGVSTGTVVWYFIDFRDGFESCNYKCEEINCYVIDYFAYTDLMFGYYD